MEKKGNDDMIFEIKTSDNRRTQHACDSVAQLDSWIYQIDKAKVRQHCICGLAGLTLAWPTDWRKGPRGFELIRFGG